MTYDELIRTDLIQAKWPDVERHVAEAFAGYVSREFQHRCRIHPIGSPIEMLFWFWWQALEWARDVPPFGCWLLPQHEVAIGARTYRVDFKACPSQIYERQIKELGLPVPNIAIELDGHEWHERTKEQVIERNQRDRELQTVGWMVYHCSGSELVRDPWATVIDLNSKIDGLFYDYIISNARSARGGNQVGAQTPQES